MASIREPIDWRPLKAALACWVGVAATSLLTAPDAVRASSPQALLDQHCAACHNDGDATANISVQSLDESGVGAAAAVWEKILRKVSAGEMPPPGIPGPTPAAAETFTAWLEDALDRAAEANPNPGRPAVHRLNRAEYSNAIRDLLELDIDAGRMLPADDSGYGFDNIADVLSLSPVRLERYVTAARRISRLAVGNPDVRPFKERFESDRETGFLNAGYERNVRHDLPFGAHGGTSLRYYFPLDAEYAVTIDLRGSDGGSHELRIPVKAGMRTLAVTFLGHNAKPESAAAGRRFFRGPSNAEEQPPMDIRLDSRRLDLIDLPLSANPPSLAAITIDGPHDIQGPGGTPSRAKIFTCRPEASSQGEPCAREILSSLARQAYRRPVTDADVSPLIALYQIGRRDGGFERGIEKALQALLVSPHFLFRVEREPEDAEPGSNHRVGDVDLASRLSFFLWSSIPDEELLILAERGKLQDPGILESQVRRMLADRRADALVRNFAGQWLYLRNVETVKPDRNTFPEFDADLRQAMRRETELLFRTVLRENRSALELLTADYTFLNERLAKHYGIRKVYGPQFRQIALADANRGGLLSQASILTVTSYPNRTSVVERGQWILENLLGMPPPPPPPDIPELEEAREDGKHITLREAMELHRANPACASCHAKMDPLGFALENYDAVGRWRFEDGGSPIDASGEFPDGTRFDGPAELKQVLVSKYRNDFGAALAEKLLTYALGRGIEYYDKPAVRSINRQAAKDDYRMADLIVSVVKSMPFQMRRIPES